MKLFFTFLFLSIVFAFSATPFAHFESKTPFAPAVLFGHLDSIGHNGNWMEWDALGVQDKDIEAILKGEKQVQTCWLMQEPSQKPLLAVLAKKGSGAKLAFYELHKVGESPVPLAVHQTLDQGVVFRDYEEVSVGVFQHLDQPSLKAYVTSSGIRFTYSNPDKETLDFTPNYKLLSEPEKRNAVSDYKAFFEYEYSLMLRAFLQSTRGIFNWQAWHWYNPIWRGSAFISDREIQAMLESGTKPAEFRLFYTRATSGETIEMKTNGNGFYTLEIRK
jgi:hypothetical protein